MYLMTTQEAARVTGGVLENLGGGNLGVKIPADGFHLMLVLDMDDEDGWFGWRELPDGSRCCDDCYFRLGFVQLEELKDAAFLTLLTHQCA
jgi:hypothetical protein